MPLTAVSRLQKLRPQAEGGIGAIHVHPRDRQTQCMQADGGGTGRAGDKQLRVPAHRPCAVGIQIDSQWALTQMAFLRLSVEWQNTPAPHLLRLASFQKRLQAWETA